MKRIRIKTFKIPIIIFVCLIFTVVAALLTLYAIIPEQKILSLITERAEKATGKTVQIGSVDYGIFGFELKKIKILESAPADKTVLLEADSINLRLSIISLLKEKISINKITIDSLIIDLEFDKNGSSNISRILDGMKNKTGEAGDESANISAIDLKNCKINLLSPPPQVALPTGRYIITTSLNIVDDKQIIVESCDLTFPDKLGRFYPVLRIDIADDMEITGKVKIENGSLDWIYKWKKKTTVPFMIINGDVIDLKIINGVVTGRAIASSTLKNSRKLVFVNGECEVDTNKSMIYIKKSSGSIEKSTFQMNYLTLNFSGNVHNFSIFNLNSQINDLIPILSFLPDKLYGGLTGSLTYNGTYNGKLTLNSVGYDARAKTASSINTTLNIENSYVNNENISLEIAGYPASMSVVSMDQSFSKFYFSVKADRIKINTDGTGSASGSTVLPIDIHGKFEIGELEIDSYRFRNTGIIYSAAGGSLNISKMSTQFMGGTINLQSNISLASSPPSGTADITVTGVKLHDLLADSKKLDKRIFGSVSGRSRMNFIMSAKPLDTLNGNIEFSLEKGKLVDTGIQHGLGIWLSELKYKLRDLEFNRIYGNAVLKGGNVTINSFIFNSQNIRLNIKGTMTRGFSADNLGIDLEFTDHFISDLTPAFILGLNRYKEGGWYVIPFSASGDIMEPSNIKRVK